MRVARVALGVCLLAGCGRFSFEDDPPDDVPKLTIEFAGTGDGTVVGPGGLQCSTTCTIDSVLGDAVTLRGLAATGSWLAGWGGPCGGNFDCDLVVDGDITIEVEFTPTPNRVFITTDTYDGAIGGMPGADLLCSDAAATAGLDGMFIAYASQTGLDASARLAGSRGWVRTDGAPVADVATDLVDGPVIFPIRLDQSGNDLGRVEFYTGTRSGTASANDCVGWSSNLATDVADTGWTSWGSIVALSWDSGNACNEPLHRMCIEVGRNVPVVTKPDTGRLAFITVNAWTPGLGRDSADALCEGEAQAAGLEGTFLAAIATTTEAIASRFPPGPPWRRVDDVRLTQDNTMFMADYLDVAPEIDLSGQVVVADFWTGTRRWNAPADAAGACGDWAIGDDTANGHVGLTSETDVTDAYKSLECNIALPLLCLEE